MPQTAYFWDESSLRHNTGRHVECIERAERLHPEEMIERVPLIAHRPIVPHGAEEWIRRVHDDEYFEFIRSAREHNFHTLDGGDTRISDGSYEAALNAVEAVLTAADEVVGGKYPSAFCAMRPPGHHALPFRAMGFCLFATASILARYVQEKHGLRRVAILDWDVHHGNGTQNVFWEDPDVFFVSLHQHPLWPGSGMEDERGEGPGLGATLNLTFAPGTPEEEYLDRFENEAAAAVRAFAPEFLIISAGFDAHKGDPLGGLRLSSESFGQMTRILKDVADDCAGGRIVSVLEGGYNLDALKSSAVLHIAALCE